MSVERRVVLVCDVCGKQIMPLLGGMQHVQLARYTARAVHGWAFLNLDPKGPTRDVCKACLIADAEIKTNGTFQGQTLAHSEP